MGYRLNVAKVYKVEYGMSGFNHQVDAVHKLLAVHCKKCFFNEDDTHIEVDCDEFLKLAVIVRSMSDDEFLEYGFDEWCPKEYVHDTLLRMYIEADNSNEYIHLFWF